MTFSPRLGVLAGGKKTFVSIADEVAGRLATPLARPETHPLIKSIPWQEVGNSHRTNILAQAAECQDARHSTAQRVTPHHIPPYMDATTSSRSFAAGRHHKR